MNSSARRVAVLGGIRIPFARQDGPYARASNQDMLTDDARRAGREVQPSGGRPSARSPPAPCSSTAATSISPGSACSGRSSRPRRRPTTSSRPAAPGLEATILVANKIALGQIESGIAGGVDTTSDAPIAINEDLRNVLLELNRAEDQHSPARRRSRNSAPSRSSPRSRATPSRGPGCRWASTPRSWRASGASPARSRTSSRSRATATWPRPTTPASSTTSSSPTSVSSATRTCDPIRASEKLAKLKPVFGGPTGR